MAADELTPDELRDVIRRTDLYLRYLEELEEIQGFPFADTPEERAEWIIDYMTRDCYEWYDIMKGARIEGFMIVGVAPDCHPKADVCIHQTYLIPKHRRKRMMTSALREIVDDMQDGVYCLIVIANNDVAREFWDVTFKRLGYHQVDLPVLPGMLAPGDEQYGYAPISVKRV